MKSECKYTKNDGRASAYFAVASIPNSSNKEMQREIVSEDGFSIGILSGLYLLPIR